MNKPDIRFNGFNGEWEEKKLGDCLDLLKDGTHGTHKDSDNGPYLLSAKNIKNGQINISLDDRKISEEDYKQIHSSFDLKKNDVLMTIVGTIGETAKIDNPRNITFQRSVAYLRCKKNILPDFLVSVINSPNFKTELDNRKSVSAQPGIYLNDVAKIPLKFTSLSEQSKIGDLFSQIDSLIASTQKEHDKLVALKKCMLQKMFPKKGSLVPEIRFEGFSGDWVEKKLGEIFRSISNAFVGTASPYYVENGHFYLESNNVKNGQINRNSEIFINDEFYYNQRHKWLHENDIVMVQSGHVGHSAVIPKELDNTAAHALIIFTDKYKTTDSYFINYSFMTSISVRQIEGITKGNTIKHILSSDMKNFIISIPNDYEEQQKIGSYFQNLDNLISKQSAELEKLKNVKKTLLSKMFV